MVIWILETGMYMSTMSWQMQVHILYIINTYRVKTELYLIPIE